LISQEVYWKKRGYLYNLWCK